MAKYTLKRILQAIPIFIGITFVVFILSDLAPGSPIDIIASQAALTDEQIEALKIAYGLDKPVVIRYFIWLWGIVRGDLGTSTSTGVAVATIIGQRLGPSLILSFTALVFSVVIGVFLGIMSAYKPYSLWDKFASGLAFIGSAMPSFFMALLLIYIFAVNKNGRTTHLGSDADEEISQHAKEDFTEKTDRVYRDNLNEETRDHS